MDRALLQQHLTRAEQHAAEGERHLARQEALIARLDRQGHDTAEARKILATLRASQTLHEQDIQRILNELEHDGRRDRGKHA
ncbi:MAG TPA: hypothetical protein VN130_07290 [Xanthobacteraceae bacterium]|nr:hypothetical protein [Xanthobacteraceae bacterium]